MSTTFEILLPEEIEKRSFAIIGEELGAHSLSPGQEAVLKRVIHTTADFDYAKNLVFSLGAVERGIEALKAGATIVTDTQMARSGINKAALKQLGGEALCFIADEDVAKAARNQATTRAHAAVEKAADLGKPLIFAVGNAPTALIRICELIAAQRLSPLLVIGAPVGFVNVVESKELLLETAVAHIVTRGRKGGSNVAAAICNALLYQAVGRSL